MVSLCLSKNLWWEGLRLKEKTQLRKMRMQFNWNGMYPWHSSNHCCVSRSSWSHFSHKYWLTRRDFFFFFFLTNTWFIDNIFIITSLHEQFTNSLCQLRVKSTHPAVIQVAIQTLKKIEESLCNFGCDHTGGKKMPDSSQKLFIWKEKAYFSEQNLAVWERRGGSQGVGYVVRLPCVYGIHQECQTALVSLSLSLSVCVCVCVCECFCFMVDWM